MDLFVLGWTVDSIRNTTIRGTLLFISAIDAGTNSSCKESDIRRTIPHGKGPGWDGKTTVAWELGQRAQVLYRIWPSGESGTDRKDPVEPPNRYIGSVDRRACHTGRDRPDQVAAAAAVPRTFTKSNSKLKIASAVPICTAADDLGAFIDERIIRRSLSQPPTLTEPADIHASALGPGTLHQCGASPRDFAAKPCCNPAHTRSELCMTSELVRAGGPAGPYFVMICVVAASLDPLGARDTSQDGILTSMAHCRVAVSHLSHTTRQPRSSLSRLSSKIIPVSLVARTNFEGDYAPRYNHPLLVSVVLTSRNTTQCDQLIRSDSGREDSGTFDH
ncbi:hypothetical protein A0H81_13539 [Grifola frondosa]|uniref:Uncharacterized protein n=1 Tax=Grifola frondosa TaxID=5627 RepID=A0A1C7LPN3_GRIFR|nr:hypothetical protein A0H81_13539 [Grifola frondosa]